LYFALIIYSAKINHLINKCIIARTDAIKQEKKLSGIAAKKGYNLDGIVRANAIRPYTLVHFAAIPGYI
jgi:hypothetical protein